MLKSENNIRKSKPMNPCKEDKEIVYKKNREIGEYITDRVQYKLNRYSCKARRFRRWYYGISIVVAVSSALVPVLVNINGNDVNETLKLTATGFSILVTIGVACQEIFRFREQWRNFDLIAANLRNEEMLYSMAAGSYQEASLPEGDPFLAESGKEEKGKHEPKPITERNRDKLFVERIEELIKNERWDTIHMRTEKTTMEEK